MSTLYILRHAESEGNARPELHTNQNHRNFTITDNGKQQAKHASDKLRKELQRFDTPSVALFSSPYLRAVETVNILRVALFGENKNIQFNPLLVEQSFGEKEGALDVYDFDNDPLERTMLSQLGCLQYKPVRGESLLDVYVRVGTFMSQQNYFKHVPSTIIVTHNNTARAFHSFLTGEELVFKQKWGNCEIRKYISVDRDTKFCYHSTV